MRAIPDPKFLVILEVHSPLEGGLCKPCEISKEIVRLIRKQSKYLYIKNKDIITKKLSNTNAHL